MTENTKESFEEIVLHIGPDDSRRLIDILKKYPRFIYVPINEYEGFWTFYNNEIDEWTRKDEDVGYVQESRRGYLTIPISQLAYAILYPRIVEARNKGWIK